MLKVVPDAPDRGALPDDRQIEKWALAYLRHSPVSFALRELNRLVAVESVSGHQGPVLDVGCGDGFFWKLLEDGREVYGIDISASEVDEARKRINAELVDVSRDTPFPGTQFAEIIGNSLEHVPDVDAALRHLRQAAQPNARLMMFVPTPHWSYNGVLQSVLRRAAPKAAARIADTLTSLFEQWHLYDEHEWKRRLEAAGWNVKAIYGVGSGRSEFLFRALLPPAVASFLVKLTAGFYPTRLSRIMPDAMIVPLAKLVRWAISDPLVSPDSRHAYEYLIIADAAT